MEQRQRDTAAAVAQMRDRLRAMGALRDDGDHQSHSHPTHSGHSRHDGGSSSSSSSSSSRSDDVAPEKNGSDSSIHDPLKATAESKAGTDFGYKRSSKEAGMGSKGVSATDAKHGTASLSSSATGLVTTALFHDDDAAASPKEQSFAQPLRAAAAPTTAGPPPLSAPLRAGDAGYDSADTVSDDEATNTPAADADPNPNTDPAATAERLATQLHEKTVSYKNILR